MKCPYCNEEMQHGELTSNGSRMDWYADGQKIKPTKNIVGISLASLFSHAGISAYMCEKCHKMIIDVY